MTVSTTVTSSASLGNGAVSTFPFYFTITDEEQLSINLYDRTTGLLIRTLNSSEYTVSGVGNPQGGSYTITTFVPSASQKVVAYRVTAREQSTSINNQGGFNPDVIEFALDTLELQIQEVGTEADRALKLPFGETPPDLPSIEQLEGKYITVLNGRFVAVDGLAGAAVNQIVTGLVPWDLPDEANGDVIPASGSGLPYLSGGALKIA